MTKTPDANAIADTFAKEDAAKKEKAAALPTLKINEELKSFLDILSVEERKGLESDLIRDGGARDPIVVWKETGEIVDGHNRYDICKLHGLNFNTAEMSFKDLAAVKEWMLENQLHRRNLSPLRQTYFLGLLYNNSKQDPTKAREATEDGKTTAAKIGEQFGVSERTVRRAGDAAKGIDAIGAAHGAKTVREKIEQIRNKNVINYTQAEVEEIGKAPAPEIAVAAVKELDKIKEAQKKAKTLRAPDPKPAAAPAAKTKTYEVVFCAPAFDGLDFSVATKPKPAMTEHSALYMKVSDEELGTAFELIKKWGLTYEGSIVFQHDEAYEGTFSDVRHTMMLVATRGVVAIEGKASPSILPKSKDVEGDMLKIINGYHPKARKIDMRKNKTATGWDKP